MGISEPFVVNGVNGDQRTLNVNRQPMVTLLPVLEPFVSRVSLVGPMAPMV